MEDEDEVFEESNWDDVVSAATVTMVVVVVFVMAEIDDFFCHWGLCSLLFVLLVIFLLMIFSAWIVFVGAPLISFSSL